MRINSEETALGHLHQASIGVGARLVVGATR